MAKLKMLQAIHTAMQHEARFVRLQDELKNAQETDRSVQKEAELRQKSERMAQLNREPEKPKRREASM